MLDFPDLLQLLPLLRNLALESLHQAIVTCFQQCFDLFNGEIGSLEVLDLHKPDSLFFLVVPVSGPRVNLSRSQQAD